MRVPNEELTLETSSLPAWTRLHLSPCPHLHAPGMPVAEAAGFLGLPHCWCPKAPGRGHSVMAGSVTAPQSCVPMAGGRQGRALQNAGSLRDSAARETLASRSMLGVSPMADGLDGHRGKKSACVSIAFLYKNKSSSYFETWNQFN